MSDRAQEAAVEELTSRFSGLEITVRRTEVGSDYGFELVNQEPSSSPSSLPSRPFVEQRSSTAQVLGAATAVELAALELPEVEHLTRSLRDSGSSWTPRARIARAFRAGVSAWQKLRGEVRYTQGSPALGLRPCIDVAIRSVHYRDKFWTRSYNTFRPKTQDSTGAFFREVILVPQPCRSRRLRPRCWSTMADDRTLRPCSRADIEAAQAGIVPGRPMPMLFLMLGRGEGAEARSRVAQAVLLKTRENGFLVALPTPEVVVSYIEALLGEDDEELVLSFRTSSRLRDQPRAASGPLDVLLADFPWGGTARSLRGAEGRDLEPS